MKALGFAILGLWASISAASAEGVWPGPNGGRMVDAGSFHVELLLSGDEYRVYVYDHVDKPVSVAKASAVATVVAGDAREKVALQPAGPNLLAGSGTLKRAANVQVLVLLRVPDQATAMARFDVP